MGPLASRIDAQASVSNTGESGVEQSRGLPEELRVVGHRGKVEGGDRCAPRGCPAPPRLEAARGSARQRRTRRRRPGARPDRSSRHPSTTRCGRGDPRRAPCAGACDRDRALPGPDARPWSPPGSARGPQARDHRQPGAAPSPSKDPSFGSSATSPQRSRRGRMVRVRTRQTRGDADGLCRQGGGHHRGRGGESASVSPRSPPGGGMKVALADVETQVLEGAAQRLRDARRGSAGRTDRRLERRRRQRPGRPGAVHLRKRRPALQQRGG